MEQDTKILRAAVAGLALRVAGRAGGIASLAALNTDLELLLLTWQRAVIAETQGAPQSPAAPSNPVVERNPAHDRGEAQPSPANTARRAPAYHNHGSLARYPMRVRRAA